MPDYIIEVIYTVLEVLFALVCCLGNLLVIWAVWKCGAMRRQPTFCFIAALAVADFLVGAVVVPIRILTDSRVHTSFYGCLVLSCGVIFFTQVSVFLQLALTIDRFLRVIIPIRYKSTVTLKLCCWVLAACWLMAAIVGLVPLMGWNNRSTMSQNTTMCQFLEVMPMSFLVYIYFYTGFLVPMLVMTALYSCIFTLIHRQLRSTNIGMSQRYFQKERNLTCSLVLVLALFAICRLPILLIDMANFYGATVPIGLVYAGVILSQASSAINPVIYALKIDIIRAPLKSIWQRFQWGKKEEVGASRNTQEKETDNSSNPQDTVCSVGAKTVDVIEQG